MKVILVDDERLALIGLQKSLEKEVSGIEIIATYMNPTEAVAGIVEHRPDVVFLDIHMPEMDGMDLGRQIQAATPGTEIIFVTSYDQYAVHAFELQALDYVMKPIQKDRLKQTVSRVREKLSVKREQRSKDTNVPLICCFNQIQFKLPGKDIQVAKWRTSKAQEPVCILASPPEPGHPSQCSAGASVAGNGRREDDTPTLHCNVSCPPNPENLQYGYDHDSEWTPGGRLSTRIG